MGTGNQMLGGNLRWTTVASHPGGDVAILLVSFMLQKLARDTCKLRQCGPVWPECSFTLQIVVNYR